LAVEETVSRMGFGKLGMAAPAIGLTLLVGSIGLGLACVLALGLGYMPALGGNALSLAGFRALFADGRLLPALGATLLAGGLSTVAATVAAFVLAALLIPDGGHERRWPQRMAVAVLAVPHVAMAIGLAFVLAPSGWIMRGVEWLTGLQPLPPDGELVPGEFGLSLALALFLKETPFLFVAIATALRQIEPGRHLLSARTMGYGSGMAWAKLVLPRLYPLVRFPIFAVLAYGLSVVDMSLILGPTTPPTLPVLILRWVSDPDLGQRFLAASAALLQLGMVAGAIVCWWLGERLFRRLLRSWLSAGARDWPRAGRAALRWTMRGFGALAVGAILSALLALLLWSVAQAWRYPAILPDAFSPAAWARSLAGLRAPLGSSIALALSATAMSLVLAIACLRHEAALRPEAAKSAERWLFLPLLVPELAFLLGLQVFLLMLGWNGTWLAVLWLHLLFVFPYVFLTLKEPWRAFDPRFERTGLSLGKSPWTVFWRIRLPMLRGPIAWSAAIGCTVSLSLYLPSVQGGEGRIVTLATEAVALSGSGDRRVAGVYGTLQALLNGLCFMAALWMARPRRWRQP
jgi:putative thiamine transport system permease protein